MTSQPPLAITGIGCRFPGGVDGPAAFWKLLSDGVDAVTEIPADRLNADKYYDAHPGSKGKSIARWGGFLDSIDRFDAGFFGISPREAAFMDPQQRLLLEAAWEALDDGGEVLDPGSGTAAGVFVGISTTDYAQLQSVHTDHSAIDIWTSTGSVQSIAANRISYCLDLHGPSVAVDTACSSSLVAVHLACTSLWNEECRLALAGGVNAIILPEPFISFSRASMLSPDGRCKAFDSRANGFVRAEGVGVVVIKPLAAALADGNPIYAVVRGTAVNQDGRTSGISLPSVRGQAALLQEVCRKAGIRPAEVQYVEAHGTGTAVGDPIEAAALGAVFGEGRTPDDPCWIGSVKTNIGHLEAGAGIAGLIKVALTLAHGRVPPSLHFLEPNPHIDFGSLKLRVVQESHPLREGPRPALAGVNSFGFGGTNAHAIIEAPPARPRRPHPAPVGEAERVHLLALSAHSAESLGALVQEYQAFLAPGGEHGDLRLDDICYTAAAYRTQHPRRLAVAASNRAELLEKLGAYLADEARSGLSSGQPLQAKPGPVFVFSGQGPQWWAMGRQLWSEEPVFRARIEECDRIFREFGPWSLAEELNASESESRLHETAIAQPAIYALQVALAALWESWGIRPQAVVGHSVGEVAAAHVAGVLSLREGARVIFHRGRCMDLAPERGRMLAAGLTWAQAVVAVHAYSDRVSVGAHNGPNSVTLSGDAGALEAIAAELAARGVFCRFLPVNYAFHSAQMDPVREELSRALGRVETHPATLCLFSTVTGAEATAQEFGAEYWWRNVRLPVRFAPAIEQLMERGQRVFVEVSAHPVLAGAVMECFGRRPGSVHVLPSLRRQEPDRATMLGSLGALHTLGFAVDWRTLYPEARAIRLPSYAWQRERYWLEVPERREARLGPTPHPLLTHRMRAAEPTWQTRVSPEALPYLHDHRVQDRLVFPAAGYVEMALGAARLLFESTACVLEEVDFQQALFLPDSEAVTRVQFSHHPRDSGFTISSSADASPPTWTVHSAGTLRAAPDAVPPGPTSLASVLQACRDEVTAETTYERYREIGLPFGPAFRGLERVWRRDGEAIGRVCLPEGLAAEGSRYQVHPGLLDACFQVLSHTLSATDDEAGRTLYLPVRIERVRFLARPGAVAWSHARLVRHGGRAIVGDIDILDEEGRVLLEITGFRCQGMVRARGGAGSDLEDCLYEYRWRPRPLGPVRGSGDFLAPVSTIRGRAQDLAHELQRRRPGQAELGQLDGDFDRLCRSYFVAALERMGWRGREGETVDADGLAQRLGVVERHRQVFGRFLHLLEQDGALSRTGAHWTVHRVVEPEDADELTRRILARFPNTQSDLALIRRCGRELAAVLQGTVDPVQLLFGDEAQATMEQFYQDSSVCRTGNLVMAEAVAAALEPRPEGRTVRILEIGAGTGGATAHILPRLPRERTDYVFSDRSATFFSRAEQKFFEYPFVRHQVLDIEKPPQEQGFEPRSFDLVLAANVLHATRDLRETLAHIRFLLAPRGLLLMQEPVRPVWLSDLVFGLLEGWWRFGDTDLRPSYPLLDGLRWQEVLGATGFEDVCAITDRPRDEEALIAVLVARAPEGPAIEQPSSDSHGEGDPARGAPPSTGLAEGAPRPPSRELPGALASSGDEPRTDTGPTREPSTWLLFSDRSGVGEQVATALSARGDHAVSVSAGEAYRRHDATRFEIRAESAEDMHRLVQEMRATGVAALTGVIHLWGLDVPQPAETTAQSLSVAEATVFYSVIRLLQTLIPDVAAQQPGLWLVTRGAQAVESGDPVAVAQAPLWGMGRVMVSELPRFRCRMVDLAPVPAEDEGSLLLRELDERATVEDEIAWRGATRYVHRLTRTSLEQHVRPSQVTDASAGYRLEAASPGSLDHLVLRARTRCTPAAHEVEIAVRAAALNFRDVMKTLGIYPLESDEDLLLGDECAGRVVAVGSDVKHVSVGDDVIATSPGCFASHVTVPSAQVMPMPERLGFDEAATMPVAFLTAWYALHHLGRVRAGDRVLIQAATGGVGLAAIQIARLAGAEIFATAGSPEKREFLRTLGVPHVMDSRSLAFADEVRDITRGRGVDLVLNSLAGEAIAKGIGCLAPRGRFLEIGKRDVFQNLKLGLRPLRENISLFVIDLAQVMRDDPPLVSELLGEVMARVAKEDLHPLPLRVFPISKATEAFRTMSQARHMGKIVLSLAHDRVQPVPALEARPLQLDADATYLVTGGLGGFGLALADWMLERGARHLVLASRGGASTPAAEQAVAALREKGGEVVVRSTDVTRAEDVDGLFDMIAATMPPLRGVVHAAMVMDDCIVAQQTEERFRNVMAPKVEGAWNLHLRSAELPLDFFVLFSSFSSVIGNPGQVSYASANSFLDGLAFHRRARGLPALVVNWGPISEVGFIARHEALEEALRQQGLPGLRPRDATAMLGRLLQTDAVQVGIVRVDWHKATQYLGSIASSPRYEEVRSALSAAESGESPVSRESILGLPEDERLAAVTAVLRELIARVLRTQAARLDMESPLNTLGMDSLMAVELVNRIENQFTLALPPGKITASACGASLAGDLLALLAGAPADATVAAGAPLAMQGPARSHALSADGERPQGGERLHRPPEGGELLQGVERLHRPPEGGELLQGVERLHRPPEGGEPPQGPTRPQPLPEGGEVPPGAAGSNLLPEGKEAPRGPARSYALSEDGELPQGVARSYRLPEGEAPPPRAPERRTPPPGVAPAVPAGAVTGASVAPQSPGVAPVPPDEVEPPQPVVGNLWTRTGREARFHLESLLLRAGMAYVRQGDHTLARRRVGRLARLGKHVLRSNWKCAIQNLKLIFGPNLAETERVRLATLAFEHHFTSYMEAMRPRDMVFEFHDGDRLLDIHAAGRGVILVGVHLGSWEPGLGWAAVVGLPMAVVYRRAHNPLSDRVFQEVRDARKVEWILSADVGAAVEALRAGKALGLMTDLNTISGGTVADFLGVPATCPSGPARLALFQGTPIVPCVAVRCGDGKVAVHCEPAIVPPPNDYSDEQVRQLTRRINAAFEPWILEYAEQYNWLHGRWRCRPDGRRLSPGMSDEELEKERTAPFLQVSERVRRLLDCGGG